MSTESPDMISAKKNPALAAALREMELNKARGPWPRRLRIIGAALAIVLIVGGAAWAIRAHLKASAKADLLAALPKNPREVFQAVRDGKIDREDAWEAMRVAREVEENKRMDEYFALKSQADRDKYLDKVIDEMEARRKEWERQAATRPTTRPDRATTRPTTGPTTRQNRRNDPGRQLQNVQGGNPVRQAQRAAMMAAMRARMAQRGIKPPKAAAVVAVGAAAVADPVAEVAEVVVDEVVASWLAPCNRSPFSGPACGTSPTSNIILNKLKDLGNG